jgi:hypothetical protein
MGIRRSKTAKNRMFYLNLNYTPSGVLYGLSSIYKLWPLIDTVIKYGNVTAAAVCGCQTRLLYLM